MKSSLWKKGIVVVIGFSFLFSGNFEVHAQETAEELRENIDVANEKIEEIEREIAKFKQEVNKLGDERSTLSSTLTQLQAERKKLAQEVSLTNARLDRTSLTLDQVRNEISTTENTIGKNRDAIGKLLRKINETETRSMMEILADNNKLSDMFIELNDLRTLTRSLRGATDELRFERIALREQRRKFQSEEEELEEIRKKIRDQDRLVKEQEKEKETLIRETKNKESAFQDLIAEREALRKAFEKELFEYESRLRFVLDPKALPPRGSSPLSWPLDKVLVTQMFGVRTGPHRIYANGHSGTDFRARYEPVYAMADGIVMGSGNTDNSCKAVSFGKWVLLRFDNNLAATYGHLSLISVESGQRVKRGQLIGYSGNTGRSTAPHLHISLYAAIDAEGNNPVEIKGRESAVCRGKILTQPRAAREAYLDPLDYLPPMIESMYKPGITR